MERLIALFVEQPLLLLFVVAAIGYALGDIRIKGTGLGVAAVLFVGLFFGALDRRMTLPPVLISLGLVLFVYSVGLSSGPGFFASFSRSGVRDNLMVIIVLVLAALMVVVEHFTMGFKATISAGIFTGALTNTPALAQVISYVANAATVAGGSATAATEPVVGYSVAYPMGVIGPDGGHCDLCGACGRWTTAPMRNGCAICSQSSRRSTTGLWRSPTAPSPASPARSGPAPALEGHLWAHEACRERRAGYRRHDPGAW